MIGIDLVNIKRFEKAVCGKNRNRALPKLFTSEELKQCEDATGELKLDSLAGRFAIKEAVIKASRGELSFFDLDHIAIRQDLKGFLAAVVVGKDVRCPFYEVSMSHDGEYAVGMAVQGN